MSSGLSKFGEIFLPNLIFFSVCLICLMSQGEGRSSVVKVTDFVMVTFLRNALMSELREKPSSSATA